MPSRRGESDLPQKEQLVRTEFVFGAFFKREAFDSAKNHKRQRRKRQSVTAKREKSQTPKILNTILTLPNLT